MAWCLVLGLLLLLRGMPSPSLPHLRPAKTSGTEMGEGQFQPGQKYSFHIVFPFPQIRTLYLGEGREGGYCSNASLNPSTPSVRASTDPNNPSTRRLRSGQACLLPRELNDNFPARSLSTSRMIYKTFFKLCAAQERAEYESY